MKYFSSFTGAGGFDLAMPQDWECVGFSEIDKYANMVLRYRYSNVHNYGNIQKIDWNNVPDFDLLTGGTPCQDLSIAGKRAGLAGERSGLFFEYVRCLKEKKPRYFIWENVKGALSSNRGFDFARVLLELSEAGYSLWWQVLDAQDFGVPQHRERIFIVGFREGSPREVFFEREDNKKASGIQGYTLRSRYAGGQANGDYVLESGRQAQEPRAETAVQSAHTLNLTMNGRRFKSNNEPSFTLDTLRSVGIRIHNMQPRSPLRPSASRGGSGHLTREDGLTYTVDTNNTNVVEMKNRIRRLTPTECERIMSWPDDQTRWGTDENGNKVEISDSQRYKMIGNGVVSEVVRHVIRELILK